LFVSRTMAARMEIARVISALVIVGLTAACGGKTGEGGATKSETSADSGVRTTDSGLGTRTVDSASACAELDVAPSDLSCGTDQDCALVRIGEVCSGQCDLGCGGTPVNVAAATRFRSDTASLTLEACPCNFPGEARCLGGQCTLCALGPNQLAACGDAGLAAPTDASGEPAAAEAGASDAPGDAGDEAKAGDAPGDARDGEADASDARPTPSIAESCLDGGQLAQECVLSWSVAENPSLWCPKMNALYFERVTRETNCSGYDVLILSGMDSASLLFYSAATGALVGIGGAGNFGPTCLAGECPDTSLLDCSDEGTEVVFFCESDGAVRD